MIFSPSFINLSGAGIDPLDIPAFAKAGIKADVLRLDKIHPVISGNKWFKLKYYLKEAIENKKQRLISFGGPFSNHIAAVAHLAHEAGLASTGIVRGEKPGLLSPTLFAAASCGMDLEFLSREEYGKKTDPVYIENLYKKHPDALLIPEGGNGMHGVNGSAEILDLPDLIRYTHICCAVGTGTMFTGLVNASLSEQKLIGICILKGMNGWGPVDPSRFDEPQKADRCSIQHAYHFGGYAKKNQLLLQFMNHLYIETGIPTDFVYTAKLLFALQDMAGHNHFREGSKLLIIHSGGLQGNASLPGGSLLF